MHKLGFRVGFYCNGENANVIKYLFLKQISICSFHVLQQKTSMQSVNTF